MKIGILTQPLQSNYGGLLQAYALQKVLRDMGHNVTTINFCRMEDYKVLYWLKKKWFAKFRNIVRFLRGKKILKNLSIRDIALVRQETDIFIQENISVTRLITSPSVLKNLIKNEMFDAYVVGSDQVWRPCYSPYIYHFYLDFCKGTDAKRIAYAASFGVDTWEYTKEETLVCKKLAKFFDTISVREESGIRLCKEFLNRDAELVLDPTLLLQRDDYLRLVSHLSNITEEENIFYYFLNSNIGKIQLVNSLEQKLSAKAFTTMQQVPYNKELYKKCPSSCIYPSVDKWIDSFNKANYVITDSFHGCVFSIIFNKPFIVLGNKERGQTRFLSLLKQFSLEERLCLDYSEVPNILQKKINWVEVNNSVENMRIKSLNFLKQSIL